VCAGSPALAAPPTHAAKLVVGTDQALQDALDNARNGDKIIGKGKPVISTIGEGEHGLDISVADGAGVGILTRGDEMVVENNTVQNLRADGLRIEGVNGTYTRNMFKTIAQDGVQIEQAATAKTLTRNVVDGAGGISYLLIGSPNSLTLNRAFNAGAMGLQDISENGNTRGSRRLSHQPPEETLWRTRPSFVSSGFGGDGWRDG
jgi:hypothetical protein